MDFTLSTPALLFSAISLLMLAYTNRFLALANLVRTLHSQIKHQPDQLIMQEISKLKLRILVIRNMQIMGVLSFCLCVASMICIFFQVFLVAKIIFGASLFLLLISLALSLYEIQISVDALNLHLNDLEHQ